MVDVVLALAPVVAPVAVPAVAGWVIWVSRAINRHEAVIEKIDKLVDVLLQDRLDRGRD